MRRWVSCAGGALAVGLTLWGTGCCDHKETATPSRIEQDRGIEEKKQAPARLNDEDGGLADINENSARQKKEELLPARKSEAGPAKNNRETAGAGSVAQSPKQVAGPGMFISPDAATPTAAGANNGAAAQEPPLVKGEAGGAIKITLAGSVLFDPGKAELKSSAHATLRGICRTIKSGFADNFIRVEGHTDSTPLVHSRGKYPDNMALSMARARSVCKFMVDEGGILAQRVHTAGYGQFRPLVHPEVSADDKARNRRVEIVILPQVLVRKEPLAAAPNTSFDVPPRE